MTIESTLPYSWLKTLPAEIKTHDEIPLWGSPPPFPWKAFADELAKVLHLETLEATLLETAWTPQNAILSNMGDDPFIFEFAVPPLPGHAYWIFPKQQMRELFRLAVGDSSDLPELDQTEFCKDFSRFLILEGLQAFQKIKFDPSLTPQLLDSTGLPTQTCLCLDIGFKTPSKGFQGRLAITPELRQSLKQKYASTTLAYPPGLSQAVTVTVNIIAGSVQLSKKEWNEVTPGDFILLDSCSLVPGEEKGRIMLTVNGAPIFRGKIKDGNIKILEYPLLQEIQTSMATKDEEFDDESLHSEHDESEFEEEDEEYSETTEEELTEEEEPTEEESLIEEETLTEEEPEEEEEGAEKEEAETKAPTKSSAPAAKLVATPAAKSLVKPEEIPVTVTVEVGRLQVSLQKLMELQPGNILELDVHPENGVDLVVNGRCIGKGELLKLGDALGVRILDKA